MRNIIYRLLPQANQRTAALELTPAPATALAAGALVDNILLQHHHPPSHDQIQIKLLHTTPFTASGEVPSKGHSCLVPQLVGQGDAVKALASLRPPMSYSPVL